MKKRFFAIIAVLLLLVISIPLIFHYFNPSRGDQPIHFNVSEGESVSSIASRLAGQDIVTSATVFRFLAWLEGKGDKIKAGDHVLFSGMHYGEVFEELEKSPVVVARVTVPEGFTNRQTATRVASAGTVTAEEFLAAAARGDYEVPNLPPEQQNNLEGYLFPKTYDLTEGMQPADLVSMLLTQFQAETADLDWSRAEALGVTPYQVLIAASIIEREAVLPEERSLVAAVIYNRLDKGMRLQMCSTVEYLLPEQKDVLTYDDLEIPSPYNTYLHNGLPPAPICNPGLASIEAALYPAQVEYLYFVATGEGNRHFFTADYNEFLKAKGEARNN